MVRSSGSSGSGDLGGSAWAARISFRDIPQRRFAMKSTRSSGATSTTTSERRSDRAVPALSPDGRTGISNATRAVAMQAASTPAHRPQ